METYTGMNDVIEEATRFVVAACYSIWQENEHMYVQCAKCCLVCEHGEENHPKDAKNSIIATNSRILPN